MPAFAISEEGDEINFDQEPQIAVDALGGAVAVWPQLEYHNRIQASTKLAGGAWGSPVDISPPGETSIEPQVAMNTEGEAVAAWIHLASERTIEVAGRTPQGSWDQAEELFVGGGGPNDLDIAIGPSGEAVVIWTGYQNTSDYIIRAATRSPDGQWSLPVELSEAGNNAWQPEVVIDPAGNIVAAWYRWNDDGDTIVQVAEKEPGQAWTEPEDLSSQGSMSGAPAVAVSAESAVVVWPREQIIEAANREAGGAWQPAIEISGPGSREPAVGMDGDGDAVALWSSGSGLDLRTAEVASLPLGGIWTEPTPIGDRLSVEWAQPQIAVDPLGRAMAVWTAWDGSSRVVEASSGAVDGSWGNPVEISSSWADRAQIAMDTGGNAAAVWRGDARTVQAAVFDVTSPELRSFSLPSKVRAGQPVRIGVSPFDAWSNIEPVSWSFGDGSIASGASVVHTFLGPGRFNVAITATDAAGLSATTSGAIAVTPALAVAARVVRVRNGRARLLLRCPGTAVCRGGVTLSRRVKSRMGRRIPRAIGHAEVAIPGEVARAVTIKLRSKFVKFPERSRKQALHAQITGDAVEPRTVVLKPLTLRPKPGSPNG
ncbi:MAG TPA: PKD domain-containing protein [Solirubrobacterales bacterium]|nr:PKD domain-containing protein [Solirubrobacterales bacterium]